MRRYRVKKMGKWWIVSKKDDPIGPYNSASEAKEDCAGLNRFTRYENEPGYVTCESLRSDKE